MSGQASEAKLRVASPTAGRTVDRFLAIKASGVTSRARRLVSLTPAAVGLRPEDEPFAPSAAHFAAANRRLAGIDRQIIRRLAAYRRTKGGPSERLAAMAMVEREVDRTRRTFGLFFEIFSQRGTGFARSLAAHDAIARDCYRAVAATSPPLLGPLLPPLSYLEHGYSPATMRRGITLSRLMGETLPFPLIRIPWDRDRPWQATFMHEVAHNLQADLGLWVENRTALSRRIASAAPEVRAIWTRWHKEIFADLTALLLGGPAVAWGMAKFLAHPQSKVATYRPGGMHPTNLLRIPILAEMLRRMGFAAEAADLTRVWRELYPRRLGHRIPGRLLATAPAVTAAVVDEIAWQARRALAGRALGDVIRFDAGDQAAIRRGALQLARGRLPAGLPPRFLVSASGYAIEAGADLARLSVLVTNHLAVRRAPAAPRAKPQPAPRPLALAA